MTELERRTVTALAGLYSFRMLGLFMVLPLLSLYAGDFSGSSALLVGIALGAYGLTQALLQIPFGLLSDRIGRKPVILFGLALFALGSLWAAEAESIYGIIGGRILQGAGAIASTVMALVADLTRDEQRTKAMAVVGMSIGASFAVALVVGPVIAAFGGLPAVFYVTAGLAVTGMLIVLLAVPRPQHLSNLHRETGTVPDLLMRSLLDLSLARLNISVFLLHFVLMAGFVALPLIMEQQMGLHRDRHWQVYLPALLLSVLGMVPLMIVAERAGRLKQAFIVAVGLIAMGQWFLTGSLGEVWFYLGLWVFFVGFNYLEATLPSLVSKTVYAGGKGTALGVFSTFQFLGAFVGGLAGGWALQTWGTGGVLWLCLAVAIPWLLLAFTLTPPRNLANLVISLPAAPDERESQLEALRGSAGVEDLMLLADEGVAYLKVDESVFDPTVIDAQATAA
jgi:MFS family permease